MAAQLFAIRQQVQVSLLALDRLMEGLFKFGDGASESRLAELRDMPYGEYLRTPEWIELRDALRTAYDRCQLCGARDVQLHVHHNNYRSRGMESLAHLVVLCADCHAWFHQTRGLAKSEKKVPAS